jgi:hypothetical protein
VSPLVFLAMVVVLVALGSLVLWVRHRAPTSFDAGIKAFRREMRALAPPEDRDGEQRRDENR